MSSQYREFITVFGDFLCDNEFHTRFSMNDVDKVKALFVKKTIAVDSNKDVTDEVAAIQDSRRRGALQRVCNAVLRTKQQPKNLDIGRIKAEEEERLVWKFLIGALEMGKPEIHSAIDEELLRIAVDYQYCTVRPDLCDMFLHLSASEMFFIDGDSLFMTALSPVCVDWDLVQPLHVMYNAQKLLRDMQARGAHFQVIFFESMLWMWEAAPAKLFLRENLRLALLSISESNADVDFSTYSFPSYHSEAFKAHMEHWEPEFFMMSDGEQLGSLTPLQAFFQNPAAEHDIINNQKSIDGGDSGSGKKGKNVSQMRREYRSIVEDTAVGDKAATYYRCMRLWAATQRLKVAYSSRIIYKENAMVVFTVRVDGLSYERAVAIEPEVRAMAQSMEHEVSLPTISVTSLNLLEEEVSYREKIVYAAVHAYLNAMERSEQERQLCEAFVITAYVTGLLNSEVRAQPVMPNAVLSAFLSEMAPYLLAVLRHAGCSKGRGQEFDIMDGHLFCAIAQQLRTTAPCNLLDADGTEDVTHIWRAITDDNDVSITDAPFASLPPIGTPTKPELQPYSPLSHELVERLALSFGAATHRAGQMYPSSFGAANKLGGWDITTPFDKLNDVTDADGEALAKGVMTEKEVRKAQELNTKFVRNAFLQAQSMGISGFAAQELAIVCSDNDSDNENTSSGNANNNINNNNSNNASSNTTTATGVAGTASVTAKKKATKEHAGQRNKKVRSREDEIRERGNVNASSIAVRNWCKQMDQHLRNLDLSHGRTTNKDRDEAIATLKVAIARLAQANIGKCFDPRFSFAESPNEVPLKLAMWRLLVASSGLREVEFALALDDPALKDRKTVAVKKKDVKPEASVLHGFNIIDRFVAQEVDKVGNWGQLDPLHKAVPDMSYVEAISYLRWVYLSYVELHIQMKLKCRVVKLLLENWRIERDRARLAQESPNISMAIPLFLSCHHSVLSVIRDEGLQISPEDLDTVRSALAHFDFPDDYYAKVDQAITSWQKKATGTLLPSMLPRSKQLFETPEMLQLIHMGHLLERPFVRKRDYRVVFNPDNWQRELLDIVDGRGSAVVCAPTSAGKTFISYYCMYNTLRRSNKKVVVYLAPVRALINQAVADVCARYGLKKYKNPGRYIYGVLGGADYHQFHDSCQVLLTVPETFETMLLSPKYADWVELIDYVILDEIHTMESNGNGDVWERILALLPCPFVALSATLGETQELCGWLNRVQDRLKEQMEDVSGKTRDFSVHVLPSEGKKIQRWNDIKKYIYLPDIGSGVTFKKLTAPYNNRYIQDLHPLSILTTDQLLLGFPPDITLVPSEVVSLFEKMHLTFNQIVWSRWSSLPLVRAMRVQLMELDPHKYFESDTYITQERARQYETSVKNDFVYWITLSYDGDEQLDELTDDELSEFTSTMKHATESILLAFSQQLNESEQALELYAMDSMNKKMKKGATEEKEQEKKVLKEQEDADKMTDSMTIPSFPGSRQYIREHIFNVLRELIVRNMGPTIVFSFETEDCGDLVKYIVDHLEEAELRYRQTEEFAQYKVRMERAAAAQEARRKQRESTLKQKRLTTGDDGNVEVSERDLSDGGEGGEELFVVPDVLPEFTFIGDKCTVEPNVVLSMLEDCEKEGEDLLLRALKRGIGMHHAGVKGKLRGHVERLFRGRHCGVIFSTETLALGIHSPCRSVVLAGDHFLLNPTQFRQMMGRAGRRGLDYLGHLVFVGITVRRIKRLMTSSMTVIKGNVQMNPMSQLRLLQLYDFNTFRRLKNEMGWKKHVLRMGERLCVNPLFFQGRASIEGGNMEAFTVEFLQMLLGFFQQEGLHFKEHTSSLGSLLQDVMYVFREAHVGNEGFAFIRMLTSGVFHKAQYLPAYEKNLHSNVMDEPVSELLAYLFSTHQTCGVPLEVHRSALLDPAVTALWEDKTGTKQHRVVLSPINICSPLVNALDYTDFFAMLSSFYNHLGEGLEVQPSTALRLPYMRIGGKKQRIFGSGGAELPLIQKLGEMSVPFKARSPFVALSGCGDVFTSVDDISFTLRDGLFCDRLLLPILDIVDGWRHDGSQVLINACLSDFLRAKAQIDSNRKNYRFTILEELNGLSQSLSYTVLHKAEKILSNLAGLVRRSNLPRAEVLTAIMPDISEEEGGFSAGAPRILEVAERLNSLQPQIQKRLAEELFAAKRSKWLSEIVARRNERH